VDVDGWMDGWTVGWLNKKVSHVQPIMKSYECTNFISRTRNIIRHDHM